MLFYRMYPDTETHLVFASLSWCTFLLLEKLKKVQIRVQFLLRSNKSIKSITFCFLLWRTGLMTLLFSVHWEKCVNDCSVRNVTKYSDQNWIIFISNDDTGFMHCNVRVDAIESMALQISSTKLKYIKLIYRMMYCHCHSNLTIRTCKLWCHKLSKIRKIVDCCAISKIKVDSSVKCFVELEQLSLIWM